MPIRTVSIPRQRLTIHTVKDAVTEAEMHATLEDFYKGKVTPLVLWDMSGADLTHVNAEMMQRFIKKSAHLGKQRPNGRTAVVAPGDLQYGLGRMSEILYEFEPGAFQFRAFRTEEEALLWLTGAPCAS